MDVQCVGLQLKPGYVEGAALSDAVMAYFNATQMRAGPDALDHLRSTIDHNRAIPPVRRALYCIVDKVARAGGTVHCLSCVDRECAGWQGVGERR
mgnify:CR=1 FL=1